MPLSSVGVLHGESGLNQSGMQNVNSQEVFTLDAAAQLSTNAAPLLTWKQSATEITLQGIQNQIIEIYQVFSNTGQKMSEFEPQHTIATIPLDQLSSGLYLVHVTTTKGQQQTFRFVKP